MYFSHFQISLSRVSQPSRQAEESIHRGTRQMNLHTPNHCEHRLAVSCAVRAVPTRPAVHRRQSQSDRDGSSGDRTQASLTHPDTPHPHIEPRPLRTHSHVVNAAHTVLLLKQNPVNSRFKRDPVLSPRQFSIFYFFIQSTFWFVHLCSDL